MTALRHLSYTCLHPSSPLISLLQQHGINSSILHKDPSKYHSFGPSNRRLLATNRVLQDCEVVFAITGVVYPQSAYIFLHCQIAGGRYFLPLGSGSVTCTKGLFSVLWKIWIVLFCTSDSTSLWHFTISWLVTREDSDADRYR